MTTEPPPPSGPRFIPNASHGTPPTSQPPSGGGGTPPSGGAPPPPGWSTLDAYRFHRHLYYATSAIVMSIPSSNSDGDRYPSAFCIRLRL